MAKGISVFEVGPRDGLQNEARKVKLEDKAWFISKLIEVGIKEIEIGAFVRRQRVPQMGDTEKLVSILRKDTSFRRAHAWSLVPNLHGLERANACGLSRLAVFTAASETFNQHNIEMSIAESLKTISEIVKAAAQNSGQSSGRGSQQKTEFRGYVSTAFGCPFEGKVSPRKALKVIERLAKLGIRQISIGDTIGVATPNQVDAVVGSALKMLGSERIAVHFHDTRGLALVNTLRALELGATQVDSSAGGLGGCPFAPGATGNLATEDLVYMLHGLGLKTGIDLDRLSDVSLEMARRMGRPVSSRYLSSYAAQCSPRN
jgi:hydroxymethylglutaryl-CoA lyase